MGTNIDMLKGELMKKPEELAPEKLKQAQGLAKTLTDLRKFLYFFFSVASAISFYVAAYLMNVNDLILDVIIFLIILYTIFKIRDYLRGTI